MPKELDLTGERFGRLTVIYRDYSKSKNKTYYYCICDCGNEKSIRADALKNGRTQSCGCYHKDTGSKKSTNKKFNDYSIKDNYVEIYTNKNETIFVDIEDFEYVKDFCWSINSVGYCQSRFKSDSITLIHREIMKNYCDISNLVIDHKNHNKLDNRKLNLRMCGQQKNTFNTGIRTNNTSGVTGVVWDREKSKWVAQIGYNGKNIFLGRFNEIEEAIKEREKAEEKYYKNFSYKNSMQEQGE